MIKVCFIIIKLTNFVLLSPTLRQWNDLKNANFACFEHFCCCFSPSSYSIFAFHTSFAPSFGRSSSTPHTKNKAKQQFAPLYFIIYYPLSSLSFRPEPSRMLITQTIKTSKTRINIKSYPISNHPKNATKNKIRIILPALICRFVEKLFSRLSCFCITF